MTMSAQTAIKKEQMLSEKVINLDLMSNKEVNYKESGYTAIYKGESHIVYLTEKGKMFIWTVSKKSGKKYKKYIN